MSGEEIAFSFGLFVILGSAALLYRYTLSRKAAERAAEANRKYKPRGADADPLTLRQLVVLWGSGSVVRLATRDRSVAFTVAVYVAWGVGGVLWVRRDAKRKAG